MATEQHTQIERHLADKYKNRLAALVDRPLIWLLPIYMAGIAVVWHHDFSRPQAALVAAAAMILLFMGGSLLKPALYFYPRLLLLAMAVFFLGSGLMAVSLQSPKNPAHIFHLVSDEQKARPVILGGVVADGSGFMGRHYRLILDSREVLLPGKNGPQSIQAVTGQARINVGGYLNVEVGDYVRLPVVLRPLKGFKNPHGFDFEKYWAAQGLWAGGFVKSPALVTSWPGHTQTSLVTRLRREAAGFIEAESLPPVSGLLAAQLAGRRGAVDGHSEEVFRALGLSHILSVSGLHLSLWYGLCFFLARFFLRRLTYFTMRFKINLTATFIALVPTVFYAMLAGADSPVVRSAVMIVMATLAILLLRRSDPWNVLAAAAWLLLLLEPYRLMTISFQLSFVATAAMVAVFTPRAGTEAASRHSSEKTLTCWSFPASPAAVIALARHLKPASKLDKPLLNLRPGEPFAMFKAALKAALAGGLGTAPLVLWHFGRFPLIGFLSNLVFTFIFSVFVLAPGLASLFILPFSRSAASFVFQVPNVVMGAIMPVMDRFAEIAGSGLMLPAPSWAFMAFIYLAGWLLLRASGSVKRRLVLAGTALMAGFMFNWLLAPQTKDLLKVTVLDVGQGSAVHINLPDGRQMLVDGGGSYNFDPGEQVITPYLLRQGIGRLDVAALTHPDQDHLKGLVSVAKAFKPREVWAAPWPKDWSTLYHDFETAAAMSRRPDLAELRRGHEFGPAKVEILWPPPSYRPTLSDQGEVANNMGLVIKISWGDISFLITGDIGAEIEQILVKIYGRHLKTTVLMAPHHGSRTSLSPDFLAAVAPEWVVFSVGRHNSYNLPHPESLKKVSDAGAMIWRTDESGAAVFKVFYDKKRDEVVLIGPPV